MSNLLNEKHALAKLRAELEKRREKLCHYYKKFGYLAHNYRNKKEGEKGTTSLQNKFKVLSSRVIVINFIWLYLYQFFDDSHSLNGYGKPLTRPFN